MLKAQSACGHPTVNVLGCGFAQKKEHDGALVLRNGPALGHRYPVVVVEVSFRHENWPLLMAEGAMWLSAATNVDFVLLMKVGDDPANFEIEVVVLGRATAAAIAAAASHKLRRGEAPDPQTMPKCDLESRFGVRLLDRRVLRRGEIQTDCHRVRLDLVQTSLPREFLGQFTGTELVVTLDHNFVEGVYREVVDHLARLEQRRQEGPH